MRETEMGFLGFLLLGLIAGAIAKLILPGKQAGGWISTLILGVVGALLGGWLGGLIFDINLGGFFELRSWLLAIVGSLIVLIIWGFISSRLGSKKAD
ncbi:GlsB/YeaQ/YmgE family stress response membrane protein [Microlunatus sp. GCM10028923]|uniref:GlsB/YeaQ/YmgE family stress response membrane protein n=1 Tax=Microlunatus sp. GCM10028923 TaxID=3273400 RepID=UPI003617081F